MPQKLDWADRHLFVGDRVATRELLNYAAYYERAFAELPRKSTTTLDERTVTKREVQTLLRELEKHPPYKRFIGIAYDIDREVYDPLRAKYESALARCSAPEPSALVNGHWITKSAIQSKLMELYKDVHGEELRFQPWSKFVRRRLPTTAVTILVCSPDFVRVFLKCTKAQLSKMAKAISEELPLVVSIPWNDTSVCLFGHDVWKLKESERKYKPADLKLILLDITDRKRQKLASLRRRFSGDAGKKLDPLREPIPESIRMYVWRRDEGMCAVCGGQDRLEFDHIIPVSKGGGHTARNLQLLCERCNRAKSGRI